MNETFHFYAVSERTIGEAVSPLSLQMSIETVNLEQVFSPMGRALFTGDLRVLSDSESEDPWVYLENNGVDQRRILTNCLKENLWAQFVWTDVFLYPLSTIGPIRGNYCWFKLSFQDWKPVAESK